MPHDPAPGVRPHHGRRRITRGVLTLLLTVLAVFAGTYAWADEKLDRTVNLGELPHPATTNKLNSAFSLGGGRLLCLDRPVVDEVSGADLKAGCRKLDGGQSLELVRERHQEADQDLSRMANQQKFLAAVAHQAETPSPLLDPFRLYPAMDAGIATLNVDKDMTPYALARMFLGLKGISTTTPTPICATVSGAVSTPCPRRR